MKKFYSGLVNNTFKTFLDGKTIWKDSKNKYQTVERQELFSFMI